MNRVCIYKVAGHKFRLCLPDSDKLWEAVGPQYEPFLVDGPYVIEGEPAHDNELIFSLSFSDTLPCEGERVCVYDMPTEDGETVVKLYRQGKDWLFESTPDHHLPICATVWASEDFSEAKIQLATRKVGDALFGVNNAAMLLYAFATSTLDTLEMHASVIENGGKAYLFLGKSGTGKSTHSSLWLKHVEGSTLMNDDNPIVRVMEDGTPVAFGSPWSGKTPCYKNVQAPVGAYVQIRQWPENRIRKESVLEAYSILYSSVSGIKDDDSAMADGLNATLDKVLRRVPCYLMDCLPDADAALVCSAQVRK